VLLWTSSFAPAAMSCSTSLVWPFDAAKMSAVCLPRRPVSCRVEKRAANAVETRPLPAVALGIESCAGGDELLDHERVALERGQDERSEPAEKSAAGLSSARPMQSAHGPYPLLLLTLRSAPAAMSCSTTGE
jgi:hypothetical protein